MRPGTSQCGSPTEPVARIGLSLARNGYRLSAASIPGSTVPACYFASSRLVSSPGPPQAPPPPPVCPSVGGFFAFSPLRLLPAGPFSCFRCLHSPPGLLHPSGSKRSTVSAALRLAFRIRPISSRSPLTVLLLVFDRGSTFQVRYASGGLLFLKPLGTFSTMIPSPFSVNELLGVWTPFPQYLFPLFRIDYSPWPVLLLWIKQRMSFLFLPYWARCDDSSSGPAPSETS